MVLRSLEPGRGPVHDARSRPRNNPNNPSGGLGGPAGPQLVTKLPAQSEIQLQQHGQLFGNRGNGAGVNGGGGGGGVSPGRRASHLAEIAPHHAPLGGSPGRPPPQGGGGDAVELPAAAQHSHNPYVPANSTVNFFSGSLYGSMRGLHLGDASDVNRSPTGRTPMLSSGARGGNAGRSNPNDIGIAGMSLEDTIQRRQLKQNGVAQRRGTGNSSDGVKAVLGGGGGLYRKSNPIGNQHGSNQNTTASGVSSSLELPPASFGSSFNQFNGSRGPGGRHPRWQRENSPSSHNQNQNNNNNSSTANSHPNNNAGGGGNTMGGNFSLFSGSFGARGGRGLMASTRAAAAQDTSFNTVNLSGAHRGGAGPGGATIRGGSPGRPSTNQSGATSSNNTNSNNNNISNASNGSNQSSNPVGGSGGGGGTSNGPVYDFRVVLSSGKASSKPIELTVGSGATQGLRPTMEDEHFCKLYSATVRDQPVSFLGILDGHCGRRVAELGSKCLPTFFLSHKALGDNNALAMVETIMQADRSIYQTLSGKGGNNSSSHGGLGAGSRIDGSTGAGVINNYFTDNTPSGGSTLICAAVHGRMLYVACLGDARAVLLDGKTTIAMSEDHKPANAKENKRIQRCGGFVQFGRVCGVLAVSRALGDFEFKSPPSRVGSRGSAGGGGFGRGGGKSNAESGNTLQELMVSNIADVRQIALTDDSKFLILACDGLWDVISNEEATQFVKDFLSYTPEVNDVMVLHGKRPRPSAAVIQRVLSNCSQKLAEFAVDRGSTDNVSVVLLFFHDVVETVVGFSEMPPLPSNPPSAENSLCPSPSKLTKNSSSGHFSGSVKRPSPSSSLVDAHHHQSGVGTSAGGGYVLPFQSKRGPGGVRGSSMNPSSYGMNHRSSTDALSGVGGSWLPSSSMNRHPNSGPPGSDPMAGSFNSRSRPLW